MNGYRKSAISAILVLTVTLAVTMTALRGQNKSTQEPSNKNSDVSQQDEKTYNERNSFSEAGPGGNWSAAILPDTHQSDDETVPLVVVETKSFAGKGRWKNLKLIGVKLRNRSTKTVQAAKLRWFITTWEDEETILAQGAMPYLDVQIPEQEVRDVDTPVINFAKEVKLLIKGGNLAGNYFLKVRVSEVRFVDQSMWKEAKSVGVVKTAHRAARRQTYTCDHTLCGVYGPYAYYCATVNTSDTHCYE